MRDMSYLLALITLAIGRLSSQGNSATVSDTLVPPVQLTAEQDRERLMKLLQIDSLRPGPSADPVRQMQQIRTNPRRIHILSFLIR